MTARPRHYDAECVSAMAGSSAFWCVLVWSHIVGRLFGVVHTCRAHEVNLDLPRWFQRARKSAEDHARLHQHRAIVSTSKGEGKSKKKANQSEREEELSANAAPVAARGRPLVR